MAQVKVSEATNIQIDWMVAKCECGDDITEIDDPHFYSTDWSQGGPIIEREEIAMWPDEEGGFFASANKGRGADYHGDTYLEAAMRCYVASRLGDEVDVPEELKADGVITSEQLVALYMALYEKAGQSGVYDYARSHPDQFDPVWARCVPCEDETPTYDGSCAVCGTTKEKTK